MPAGLINFLMFLGIWFGSIPKTIHMDHSFSTYAKFSENLTCAYQGVRNVSFSENFTNILNE